MRSFLDPSNLKTRWSLAALGLLVVILAGPAWAGGIGLPNPADVHCSELGYQVETLTAPDGAQSSICVFPDGTNCDAWRFLAGTCGEKFSYCAMHGYGLKVVSDGRNSFTRDYAVCTDPDTGAEIGSVTDLLDYHWRFFGRSGPRPEVSEPREQQIGVLGAYGQPPSFDWRTHSGFDWMTPVKNQSQCGSCWAFSAVGTTEAAYNIYQDAPNLDIDLSEEWVNADCNSAGSSGCCGGFHDRALEAIRDRGVPDEECLAYDVATYNTSTCSCYPNPPCTGTCPNGGGTDECSLSFCDDACVDSSSRLVDIREYHGAGANDIALMKQNLIEHGPLSVSLDFDCVTGGDNICRCNCDGDCGSNHCVIITGYDDTMGDGVWIIKNSWGAGDGPFNDGYRFIPYGDCLIEAEPYWVEVDDYFPILTVPGSLTLGETCGGDTSYGTLDVCNTGMANLRVDSITSSDPQFGVTAPSSEYPVTISPDFCFPFQVSFSPAASGPQSATLTIESNDISAERSPVEVTVSGAGGQQEIETVIADQGDFGDVCLGSFKDLDLTISNSGTCDLSVDDITSNDAEFLVASVISFPLVIGAGDSLAVPIRFQPTSLGGKNAVITIDSDDPNTPVKTVAVSGNVVPGDIRVTGSTVFGDVCAEENVEKTVSICNVGACNLEVSSASVDCADFTLMNNPFPATVSPDSCLDLVVAFTPTSAGPKSCVLTINSDDPDTPVKTLELTANTPFASIDVPPDQGFRPTVVQSVDVCESALPFPVSNTGRCNLEITDLSISSNAAEYSLSGLPSFPIILEAGDVAGSGALNTVFAPQSVDRDDEGAVSVTYVSDPVTGDTMTVVRDLCGEGVRTGARVLVTQGGVPLPTVKSIRLSRINANRNKDRLDTKDNARNVSLQSVTPNVPCAPSLYHREYGTVSNPVQLLPGSYEVTVQTRIDGKMAKRTVGFDVDSCGFNPTIVVNF
jgi:putative hemolysin